MRCPYCNTLNEANSRFCTNCGREVSGNPGGGSPGNSAIRRQLGLLALRTVIGLLLIFFIRSILNRLSFVVGLRIDEVPFGAETMINVIAYLTALLLLLLFAQRLRGLWPSAYPRYPLVGTSVAGFIYVVALAAAYSALLPPLLTLLDNPRDIVLILRLALTFVALIFLAKAGYELYETLPEWIADFFSRPLVKSVEEATPDET